MSNLEKRPYGWERRATIGGTASHPIIRGTPIVFDVRSQDLGGFVEIIKPEAFRRTMDEGIDLRAFFGHDPDKVLGRQSSGTLKVRPTPQGVGVEIDPPRKSNGDWDTDPSNLRALIERGDINGMSFSFRVMGDGEDWKREGGQIIRYVNDMRVYEVSIVSMPAYEQTDVEVALRGLARFRPPGRTVAELQVAAEQRAARWR
jgi:HK97 family phage prohead protease